MKDAFRHYLKIHFFRSPKNKQYYFHGKIRGQVVFQSEGYERYAKAEKTAERIVELIRAGSVVSYLGEGRKLAASTGKKPISKRDPLAKAFDDTASWQPTAVKSAKKKAEAKSPWERALEKSNVVKRQTIAKKSAKKAAKKKK